MSVHDSDPPGCPDFAFDTMVMMSWRIELAMSRASCVVLVMLMCLLSRRLWLGLLPCDLSPICVEALATLVGKRVA